MSVRKINENYGVFKKILLYSSLVVAVDMSSNYTANASSQVYSKAISGNRMVYMKYDGDWNVYLYDLQEGKETPLTNAPGAQGYPAISGHYVAWQDNRNYIGSSTTKFDVYLYDLDLGEKRKINQLSGYNQSIQIQGDHVVWIDNSDTNYNVYVYDIKTGIEKKITNSTSQASGVQISDNQIVWMDGRNGNLDIYSYNLTDGKEKQITSDPSRQTDPMIVGGTVVWQDERNGIRQVYMYDSASGKEKNISSNTMQPATLLSASDGKIVYRLEGALGRVLVFDTVSNKEYQLVGTPLSSDNLLFSNGNMYWKSGDKWKSEPVMDHAIPLAETMLPVASSDPSWTSIGTEGGTVNSPDGQFKITLPHNAAQEAIKVRIQKAAQIQQTAGWPQEFQPITSFYTFEKQGKIAGDAVLHFSGMEQWKGKIDTRKVRLFKLDQTEAKWLPVDMPVTQFDGSFHIAGEQLGTFALGYYQKSFPDLTTHWARDNVEVLAAHDMIRGYENSEFRPDKPVTRAEFVSLMVRAMKWQSDRLDTGNHSFDDVHDHWAEKAIQIASAHGVVHGDQGVFRPDDAITREEMTAMLMRSLQDQNIEMNSGVNLNEFADQSDVSVWARGSMEQAVHAGLIRGKDGRLAPMDNTTRAEAATVILLSLDKLSL